jgi:hypothetical protein
MNRINFSFKNYLRALRDISEALKQTSKEERYEFFNKIQRRMPFPFFDSKEYEHFFRKSHGRGFFPFPFFPPHPKYWDHMDEMWDYPFDEILRELESEFEVEDNRNQELSHGERQISQDVKYLSSQFMKLTETSAKLEQEVFKISFIKDLPKNVVGHITEDGTFKFVEPGTKKEWNVTNLIEKEKSLKENITELIENNKGNKNNFVKELKILLDEKHTLEI